MYTVSVIIPTFNSENTLFFCLDSLKIQKYPKNKIEIILIDGGSSDATFDIARDFKCRVYHNPYKVQQRARPIGIEKAKGELILILDSDNILESKDWLSKMVLPFADCEIAVSEPIRYSYRKGDNLYTRYVGLIGADDPILVYLGFYDRFSYLTNKWTGSEYKVIAKKDNYLKIKFTEKSDLPPLGANGTLIRKNILNKVNYNPYLHIDVLHKILNLGFFLAKVDIGIVHLHAESMYDFLGKKKRRFNRRVVNAKIKPAYTYKVKIKKVILFIIKFVLFFPLVVDSIRGFLRRKDIAWFLHPIIVINTFFVYLIFLIEKLVFQNIKK